MLTYADVCGVGVQSAQLFDAEADEAASYMSMFGADAQQAHLRQVG
jgi:hypothetical protein